MSKITEKALLVNFRIKGENHMKYSMTELVMLSDVLSSKLKHYSDLDFIYMNHFKQGLGSHPKKYLTVKKRIEYGRNQPILTTDPSKRLALLKFRTIVGRSDAKVDDRVLSGHWPQGFVPTKEILYLREPEARAEFEKVRKENNIESSAYLFVSEKEDDFVGVFLVISEQLDSENLIARLQQDNIEEELKMLHFYMTRKHPKLTNPMIYSNFLKPKTLKVVELTCYGLSSKEISELLHLTERGVHYHLDQAKEILKAKNKAELVSKAHKLCVL